MPDFSSASALSAVSTAAYTASGNDIVIEAIVGNAPDKLQQLGHQIEVSGTLAEPPSGSTIILNTAAGVLNLQLPQLAQLQQAKLTQQLLAAFQNQRPLTVLVQPGNPPGQATVLLPASTSASVQNVSIIVNQTQQGNGSSPQPLPINVPLAAIVLPNDVEVPMLTQAQFQAQMPVLPSATLQAYKNFNSNPEPEVSATPLASALEALASETIPSLTADITSQTFAAATVKVAEILTGLQQEFPAGSIDLQNASATPQTPSALPVSTLASTTAAPISVSTPSVQEATSIAPQTPGAIAPVINPEPASASSLASLLQPGNEVNVRVTAIIDPSAGGRTPPLQSNQVLGTVIGNAPNGQLIVKTDDATLFVRQPASAPAGTQLILTVEPGHNAAPALVTTPDPTGLATLPQVIAALAQADPTMLQQIMANRMPQPGQSLPGTLLFFLSAVRDGDVRGWLGNGAADLLTRAGKAELINRLAQELQTSGQPGRDDVVGEWRSYAVPVLDNHQLAYLYFHIHGERRHHQASHEKEESKNGSQQMRFVIDMRMSRLGPMQLDGFLRPRKLDIIMRSERRLPPWVDNELRQTYTRTLGAIGYSGGITFQSGRGNWVNVQKPAAGKALVT